MSYLKEYQQECVDRLTVFFRRTRSYNDPREAFEKCGGLDAYHDAPGLAGMPYVCIKVPTGGGKTAIAAYCVQPMLEVMGQRESGPVLWLAPSKDIVNQTVEALRDRGHPYRQALDAAFDGRVAVMDIRAALGIGKSVIENNCVVIVSTIQALKREDPEKLKVFNQNGTLLHHFTDMTPDQRDALLSDEQDDPLSPTLRNVIRMHRPVVIMDEAHNARNPLDFETLQRFGPSCVLELTATPRDTGPDSSNVLLAVSAAKLKSEEMIKLPVMLRARKNARDAIASSVHKRNELQELASAEAKANGYVRPIVLYHAQNSNQELNPNAVKRILVEELKIDEDRVAIRTGETESLPSNILEPDCPVEHIITIQALREGWDCPFAYVLCSVANLSSATAVEQFLGRILRMPYAKERSAPKLNQAYCYATSPDFQETANKLEMALVESCGFSKYEARRMVQQERDTSSEAVTLFNGEQEPVTMHFAGMLDSDKLSGDVKTFVSVEPKRCGGAIVTWAGGGMDEHQQAAIIAASTDPRDAVSAARLQKRSWQEDDYPAAVGVSFRIPSLAVKESGKWYILDDQPMELGWTLSGKDPSLDDAAFSIGVDDNRVAVLNVNDAGAVRTQFIQDMDKQIQLFAITGRDTPAKLANWLDQNIRDQTLTAVDKREFILRAVEYLVKDRGMEIGVLDRHRFELKKVLSAKIAALRLVAERTNHQLLIDGDGFGVSMDCCIEFPKHYPADSECEATFEWQKHYYGTPAAMNGAELEVAKYLDSHPKVLHWVRNLDGAHHVNHAFWLRRVHGRFFPDFVAELVGERYLVVEDKGAMEGKKDEEEKRRIGELWAAAAPEHLKFVWALKADWQQKIAAAIGESDNS